MKELEEMLTDLIQHITIKELALFNTPLFNSYIDSQLINRHQEIAAFEKACKEIETNPIHKRELLRNFQKEHFLIKTRIAEIPHK